MDWEKVRGYAKRLDRKDRGKERRRKAERRKAEAERKFDEQLRLAIEFTRDARAAAYRYARSTGGCELKNTVGQLVPYGFFVSAGFKFRKKQWLGGEIRTVVAESPLPSAKPKRCPDPDKIGAPVVAGAGVSQYWANSRLGPVDYELVKYWRGWSHGRPDYYEVKRLSVAYRRMLGIEETLRIIDVSTSNRRVVATGARGGGLVSKDQRNTEEAVISAEKPRAA